MFLGQGDLPAKPPLPFLDLPPDQIFISRSIAPCNWLQGVEGIIDSVHVGTLHKSWMMKQQKVREGGTLSLTLSSHPRYEVDDTPYGIRAAALRSLPDGKQYIRISEYILPFTTLVAGSGNRTGSMFIAVPIDNVSHMLFWGLWDEDGGTAFFEAEGALRTRPRDIDNYALVTASADRGWGQNRDAMANGHFTGFDACLLDEDMVVQASVGLIVDRSIEHLCASDVGLVRARRRLQSDLATLESCKRSV